MHQPTQAVGFFRIKVVSIRHAAATYLVASGIHTVSRVLIARRVDISRHRALFGTLFKRCSTSVDFGSTTTHKSVRSSLMPSATGVRDESFDVSCDARCLCCLSDGFYRLTYCDWPVRRMTLRLVFSVVGDDHTTRR